MYSVYLLELQNKEVLRQSEKFFPPTISVAGEPVPEQPPTHTQAHAGQIPPPERGEGPHAPGQTGSTQHSASNPPKTPITGRCLREEGGCGEKHPPARCHGASR